MIRAGYSARVRLFEAAACGTPIISDRWNGLDTMFKPNREILLADAAEDVLSAMPGLDEAGRKSTAEAARVRALAKHPADHHRAMERERRLRDAAGRQQTRRVDAPTSLRMARTGR